MNCYEETIKKLNYTNKLVKRPALLKRRKSLVISNMIATINFEQKKPEKEAKLYDNNRIEGNEKTAKWQTLTRLHSTLLDEWG